MKDVVAQMMTLTLPDRFVWTFHTVLTGSVFVFVTLVVW